MRILIFSWLFLVPLYSIFFTVEIVPVGGQCLNEQSLLLLQMKNSLKFEPLISTKLVKWDQSVDCCSWSGVTCDDVGHVIGLDLSSESISGGIDNSSSLLGLQYLKSLNLAYNSFNSTEIPPGFDKLTNLTYLNLSNANFAGQIPIEISRMTRLVTLDLSIFSLLGVASLKLENPNLAVLLQNLTGLTELYLDGVNISAQGNDWCLALSSSLPNLRVLSLSDCNLSGPFYSSLETLRFLSVIRLDRNNFSAPVPEFFANFTNLTSLRLSSSSLYGTFPKQIFQVPTLQNIDLSNNLLLRGSLPDFPRNGSLQTLLLSDTNFTGELRNSISNLERLSRIELVNCSFSGSIPKSMENLTQLVYMDFSYNSFSGSIPSFRLSKNLTKINLSYNRLTGQIPSYQWEGLMKLEILDLRCNSLNGTIPSSLFSLPSLQKILLSNNIFGGQFEEFSNVSSSYQLDTLDLSSNRLKGPIPMSVFKLQGLNVLTLSNNLFNGTIELSMTQNCTNLTTLDLSFNNLSINTGGSNSAVSTLPQFSALKLASCNLGVFPNLENQTKLVYLDLSDNQIGGRIPNWIWKVGNGSLTQLNLSHNMLVDFEKPLPSPILKLSVLDLHSNMLQGEIPILASSASVLDYSSNNFSSSIPADIGNIIYFTVFFSLSKNALIGTIPPSICNATYLQVLDLSSNHLSGSIPPCLFQISDLGVLNLRRNALRGTIPDTFQSESKLKTLDVNGNRIDGPLPRSLANCSTLEVLNLGNNQINDSFPCWMKNSSNLRVLVLRNNRFNGSVVCPVSFSNSSMLQIIDLSSNNFSGNLPRTCFLILKAMMPDEDALVSVANHLRFAYLGLSHLYYQDAVTVTLKGLELELVKILTVFTSIDFSCNSFEGDIPDVLGQLKALYVLNLSQNAFTGQIPASLGNLTQLGSLDLSKNKLIGTIPVQLASLTFLSYLNLSFNQLVGGIPSSTQLQSFNETSFEGNKGLCGPPLKLQCANDEGASPGYQGPVSSPSSGFDWQFIMTGLGFGFGAGVVVGPLMFWKKGRKWYDKQVDAFVLTILALVGYDYTSIDYGRVEAEESIETELTDITGDANDDEEDETEDDASRGRFCVFCSKLDIKRKKAIHNPTCTCHISPPISSSSSYSSSSSS